MPTDLTHLIFIYTEGNINYTNSDRDRMICLDTLAAYYVQEAKKEKNKEKKKEMFTKVKSTFPISGKLALLYPVPWDVNRPPEGWESLPTGQESFPTGRTMRLLGRMNTTGLRIKINTYIHFLVNALIYTMQLVSQRVFSLKIGSFMIKDVKLCSASCNLPRNLSRGQVYL